MKRRFEVALVLGIVLLALLVSPGSLHAQGTSQEVTFTLSEFTISPSTITVKAGTPVHFTMTNTGKYPHTVTFMKDSTMATLTAKPLAGGETASADYTFDTAGTWEMHCPVGNHAAQGMVGQVVVTAADVVSAPGMPTTGQPENLFMLASGLLGLVLLSGGLIARRRQTQATR